MAIPSKKTVRKIVLVLLALLAAAMLIYLFVVRPIQVRQEKKQFVQAAAELEKLYTQIEAVAGKPDQVKREKSCDYVRLGLNKGPRSCTVTIHVLYDNAKVEGSNRLKSVLSALFSQPVKPGFHARGDSFIPETSTALSQSFSQKFFMENNFSCSISYIYPARDNSFSILRPKTDQGFVVRTACNKDALSEHYPLRN